METLHETINKRDGNGDFLLSPLPYTDDHLEPYISERTVRFHYWHHLKAYVNKVNLLKDDTSKTIEEIITENKPMANDLFNNASQVFNHYFYFEQLNPRGAKEPLPKMRELINDEFGCFEKMKERMIEAGMSIFGSGWVYLTTKNDALAIMSYTGTGTPTKSVPLIALDVWEHAYYLDYQDKRKSYINNFFASIDWNVIERRLL